MEGLITAGSSLAVNSGRYPDKPALVIDGVRRTYKTLNERANQVAWGLYELGISKGDLVGILSRNSVSLVEALYGTFKLGAIAVLMNYRLLREEIKRELARYRPKVLFFSKEFSNVVKEYVKSCNEDALVISLDDVYSARVRGFSELVEKQDVKDPDFDVKTDNVAVVVGTGGTTGTPKGVRCLHKTLAWISVNYMVLYDTPRPDHVMVHPYPLFHGSGTYRLVSYLWAGATYVTMSVYDTRKCMEVIQDSKANVFIGSSAVFVPMLEAKKMYGYDTRSIRIVCATFGFTDDKLFDDIQELFPNARIYVGYGFTEGGAVSALRPDERPREKGSVGRPSPFTEVRIFDENGIALPPGKVGEICVRGPNIVDGYFDAEEKEASSFKNGWFRTGDLGRMDEDGYLYMVGRKKDMIKTGGENVYAWEVEQVILSHPEVREVAVIGVPHKRWGETIRAVVVRKKGSSLTEDELISFCRERLASYKKPTSVVFVDEIPKTETGGKVLKTKIKELYGKDV